MRHKFVQVHKFLRLLGPDMFQNSESSDFRRLRFIVLNRPVPSETVSLNHNNICAMKYMHIHIKWDKSRL